MVIYCISKDDNKSSPLKEGEYEAPAEVLPYQSIHLICRLLAEIAIIVPLSRDKKEPHWFLISL